MKQVYLCLVAVLISFSSFAVVDPITGTLAVCDGSTTSLSSTTPGGTWSSDNLAVAFVDASGTVTAIAVGLANITYTVGVEFATAAVTVNPNPVAIAGPAAICAGSTSTMSTSSGFLSSSNPAVIAISGGGGIMTGVSVGTAIITFTMASTGCFATRETTVNPVPSPIANANMCLGSTSAFTNSVSGGSWSSSTPAVAVISASTGVATAISLGTTTISYALPSGCATVAVVTVSSSASPIIGATSVCPGETASLSDATPGGTWSTSDPSIGTVSSAGLFTGVTSGIVNISYSIGAGCSAITAVTVYAAPTIYSVTGGGAYCTGGGGVPIGLSGSQPGVNYQLYNGSTPVGSPVSGTGSALSFGNQTATGTYNVQATSLYACTSAMAGSATVSIGTAPGIISGTLSVCVGSSTTLTNSMVGGTWSIGGATAVVDPTSGVVTGLTPGTAAITYSAGTCGDVYDVVTVNPLPAAITGTAAVCAGSATSTLSNTTPGGVWSSDNTTVATVGGVSGILSGIATGTATISYTLSTGCANTVIATVNSAPGIVGTGATACSGSSTTLSNTGGPGTWTSSDPSIATVSSSGVVTGVAGGTVTITLTNACSIATQNISIGAASSFDLSVSSSINYRNSTSNGYIYVTNTECGSVSPTVTMHLSPKYTLVSSSPAAASVVGNTITWNLSAVSSSGVSTRVIYVVLSPAGTVTVGDTVHTDYQVDPVSGDANTANNYVATVRTITGSYDPNEIAVSPTGYVLPCQELTYRVQFENDGNDTAFNIYVLDTLSANLDPATLIGVSSTHPMNMSVYSSGGYNIAKFDFPGINLPDSSHHGLAVGEFVYKIKVFPSLADGLTINNRAGIYFDASPVVMTNQVTNTIGIAPITGPASVCRMASITLSNATDGGSWASTNGRTMVSGGIVTGISSGLDTISYTTSNSCASRTAMATVSVNTVPAVSPIAGASGMCVGATTTMTSATPGGSWTSSNMFAAPVGLSDGVVYGATSSVVMIAYTMSNACGDSVATTPLIIDPVPFAGTITGLSMVCEASSITLSNTTPGGAWTSSNTAMAVVGSAGNVSGISGGTVTISYAVSNACSTAVATLPVYVNPLPDAGTISGSSAVCSGYTTPLTGSVPGGTWSSLGTVISVSSTGVVSGLAPGTGNVYYTVTNVCGSDMTVFPINVETLPSAGAIVVPGDVCPGHSMLLTDTVAGGIWGGGSAGIATISGAGVVMAVAPGTTTVSYSLSNSCGTALATAVVTVSAVPTVSAITGATMICSGETATMANATSGGVWSGGTSGVAFVSSTGIVTALAAGTTTVSYSLSNSCGTAVDTATLAVNNTYNPLIIITANPGTIIAAGQTVTLSAIVSGGGPAPDYQWMKNGVPMAGQTASTFVSNSLADADSITCRVTGTGSCGKVAYNSVIMSVSSGAVNVAANTSLSVYPNPSRGILMISGTIGDQDEAASVVITNMLGQVVYQGEVAARNGNINAQVQLRDDIASGTYLLSIRSAGINSQAHFVLER